MSATKARPIETVYEALPGTWRDAINARKLAEVLGMAYSTVTRHLRALEAAGRAGKVPPSDTHSTLWFRADAEPSESPAEQRPEPEPAGPDVTAGSGHTPPGSTGEADARLDTAAGVAVREAPTGVAAPAGAGDKHPASRTGEAHATTPGDVVADLTDAILADLAAAGDAADLAEAISERYNPDTAWRPARPGDTPGALVPGEGDVPQPVDLAADYPDGVLVDGDPSPISPAPTGGDVVAIAEWMAGQRHTTLTVEPDPPAAGPDRMTAEEARALTDDIRARVTDLLPLIRDAFTRRADLALGYASWAAYCDAELAGLRMPLEERQAATVALRAGGMSTRAIAGALGTSDATVRRDLRDAPATNDAPARVAGLDGKRYAASRPADTKTAAEGAHPPADGADTTDQGAVRPALPEVAPVAGIATPAPAAAVEESPAAAGVTPQTAAGRPAPADAHTAVEPTSPPADGVADGVDRGVSPAINATPAPSLPSGEGSEGVTPDPREVDAAAERLHAERADAAVVGVLRRAGDALDRAAHGGPVIDGEAVETPTVDPADPGPVPEPPPLDVRVARRIDIAMDDLAAGIENLAVLLRQAGPHAGQYLKDLRHWRREMDLMIRAAETAADQ